MLIKAKFAPHLIRLVDKLTKFCSKTNDISETL